MIKPLRHGWLILETGPDTYYLVTKEQRARATVLGARSGSDDGNYAPTRGIDYIPLRVLFLLCFLLFCFVAWSLSLNKSFCFCYQEAQH